jgi:hypothetical protein
MPEPQYPPYISIKTDELPEVVVTNFRYRDSPHIKVRYNTNDDAVLTSTEDDFGYVWANTEDGVLTHEQELESFRQYALGAIAVWLHMRDNPYFGPDEKRRRQIADFVPGIDKLAARDVIDELIKAGVEFKLPNEE